MRIALAWCEFQGICALCGAAHMESSAASAEDRPILIYLPHVGFPNVNRRVSIFNVMEYVNPILNRPTLCLFGLSAHLQYGVSSRPCIDTLDKHDQKLIRTDPVSISIQTQIYVAEEIYILYLVTYF